jgi:gelsolin
VKQVPFSRSSLNHDDVFVFDIEIKIYQNIQHSRKDKAWDVVQCIEVKYQKGECEIAVIKDCLIMEMLEVSLNIR